MGKFLSRREFLKGLAAAGAGAAAVGLFRAPAFAEGTDKYNGPPVKTTDQEKIVNKTDFGCIPSQDRARQAGRQPPAKRVEEP